MAGFRLHHRSSNLSLGQTMLLFALPIMAVNILQLLFNAADMIVVGRFEGSRALAAVGATGALFNLIVNLFMGLSVGTSVIVARAFGAKNLEDIRQAVHTSIAVGIIGGIMATGIGLAFCTPLLHWMGTPDEILGLSSRYMAILFYGMPASMVFNFGAAILRAVGDSKRPMYFLVVSGTVNVALNVLFVAVLRWGVAGVAWSTTITQYLAMALIIASLMKQEGALRFSWNRLKIHTQKLALILKIGVPAGLQGVLFSISNVLIQSAVNSFGTTMVAASAASSNVENLVATPMNAYYQAAITYAGQSMGAEDYDAIDRIAKISTGFVFVTWLVLGGITLLLGRTLLGFYVGPHGNRFGHGAHDGAYVAVLHLRDHERVSRHHPCHGLLGSTHAQYAGGGMPYAHRLAGNRVQVVSHADGPVRSVPCDLGTGRSGAGGQFLLCPQPGPQGPRAG